MMNGRKRGDGGKRIVRGNDWSSNGFPRNAKEAVRHLSGFSCGRWRNMRLPIKIFVSHSFILLAAIAILAVFTYYQTISITTDKLRDSIRAMMSQSSNGFSALFADLETQAQLFSNSNSVLEQTYKINMNGYSSLSQRYDGYR
jgi:hypothetical protein